MNIKYSVEFTAVKFTKYKQGSPKHLLAKVGRWQIASDFGGWDNIDYEPTILTDNKSIYECAPEMYEMLTMLLEGDSINDSSIDKEVVALLERARGE